MLIEECSFLTGADMPSDPAGDIPAGPSRQPHQAQGSLGSNSQLLQAAVSLSPGEFPHQGPSGKVSLEEVEGLGKDGSLVMTVCHPRGSLLTKW